MSLFSGRTGMLAALLGGLALGAPQNLEYPYYKLRTTPKGPRGASLGSSPRWGWSSGSRDYPHSSTRQGERLARQKAKYMLDFSATEKCLARIRERTATGHSEKP
ncbi:MAG TPA: hypothetical protein VLH12_08505 [Usitatibacter sp.]|nr:hypothetical protein [Usitatibacter sp.]